MNIADDDKLTVEFSQPTGSDPESGGGDLPQLLVTGELEAGYSVDVSVAVTGGTASTADYTNTATVTILGGAKYGTMATAVTTNLAITPDGVVEPDETIQLTLSAARST